MKHNTPAGTSPHTAEPTRPTWVRWKIVALLVTFSFMTWFNRVSMSVAYDEQIQEQYRISPEEMGYVYSAFLFAYMLCMTPGGWLIDRFGTWVALVVMGFGSALLGALTGVAGLPALVAAGLVLPALLVIRSLMGMLTTPVYPASARVVSHWLPVSQRAWGNGLVQGAAAVGIACTFPVFGALIDWFDWQIAFLISGAYTALLALGWTIYATNHPLEHHAVNDVELRLIDPDKSILPSRQSVGAAERPETANAPVSSAESMLKRNTGGPPGRTLPGTRVVVDLVGNLVRLGGPNWRTLLGNRSLMLLTISYAALGYIEYLFFFWMHYYFEKVLHLGKGESRVYAAILTLAMAMGMVLGGWAADRLRIIYGSHKGRALVPVVGMFAGGTLLVLGLLAEETAWIVTLLALALAAVGAVEAPVWTTAIELGGRQGGTAAGICNTGGNAGGLVAPILTPLVSGWLMGHFGWSEQLSWQWAISLGSMIAVLGAVLWFWITPAESQDGRRHIHS
jgi:ACS family D-galactonate transporter-like MFS transporter